MAKPRCKFAQGVVPRVKRPDGAAVIVAKPLLEKEGSEDEAPQPLYAKLRAEEPTSNAAEE